MIRFLSGGSGLCGSDKNIANICKEATVKSGTMLNHFSAAKISEWAKNINLEVNTWNMLNSATAI